MIVLDGVFTRFTESSIVVPSAVVIPYLLFDFEDDVDVTPGSRKTFQARCRRGGNAEIKSGILNTTTLTRVENQSRHSSKPLVGPSLKLLEQWILLISLSLIPGDEQENWEG